ncbi:MAG: glycosyltransferase, partial [Acidobacteriota bacterium]
MRSRFQFHGKRSRIELMGLLGKARIGVVPSRWENFPNTCVEMMCSGLPVIATRMGGMAEMINDNKSGWLSNSPRPDDLADALTRALEVSPSRLAEMGNQAVLDIRSICDNKKIVDLHLELRRRIAIEGVKRSFRIPPNLPWANRNPSDESVRRYPKDTSPKGIAVVIDGLNFNGDLSHCLRGIKRQIRPPVAVVLLVESKQDEKLKDIIQDAQLPELSVCEVEDHSSPVVKNHGIQYVLSSGATPIGFVFLDSRDLLYAGFIETTESALENCPDVGLVSSWMQIVGEGYKVSVS